jgi:hypothetical protein
VIGLRTRINERGDFLVTTIPPVSESAVATGGELVFPHIVNGGGYSTEFVVLGRAAGSSGRLLLLSQTGAALSLGVY